MSLVNACSWFAASAGTGDFTFGTARPSFATLAQAVAQGSLLDGQTVSYLAQDQLINPKQREWGHGTFHAAGAGSITRTAIDGWVNNGISGSGSPVNFTFAPLVSLTSLAFDLRANPLGLSVIRVAPWDNFDAPDGTLLNGRITPSGHALGVSGTGQNTASINGGGYIATATTYVYLTDTQDVVEAEGVFSWDTPGSPNAGVISLVTNTGNLLGGGLFHVQFTAFGFNVLTSTTGAGGLAPFTGTVVEVNGLPLIPNGGWLGGSLRQDLTRYKIRVVANKAAGTLLLYLPDGRTFRYTGSQITSIIGNGCYWQNSSSDFRWHSCAIGPSRAGDVTIPEVVKDFRPLIPYTPIGYRTQLQIPQVIPLTANGWYTIATQNPGSVHSQMGGTVVIFGSDVADRKCLVSVVVGTEQDNSSPSVFTVIPELGSWAGGVVDQVRVSQQGANIQLDIHVNTPNAANSTLYATFDGAFTVVAAPVVGAVALTDWAVVKTAFIDANDLFQNGFLVEQTFSGTVGWSTFFTQEGSPWTSSGHPYMCGRLVVQDRSNSGRNSGFEVTFKAESGSVPVLAEVYAIGSGFGGYPIPSVRLSTDDTNHLAHLDLDITDTGSNQTVYARLFGFAVPVTSPVGGATALPTNSTVLNL